MIICTFSPSLAVSSSEDVKISLLTLYRFVPEGKHDHVVGMLRTMAEECKEELSRGNAEN